MSLTSKQTDNLRTYAKDCKGELAKLITDAADTIELLSTKLTASNMERSSQYYHSGWIPCEERLPEPDEEVLVYLWGDVPYLARVNGEGQWETDHFYLDANNAPKAWMPLPEPARWDGA